MIRRGTKPKSEFDQKVLDMRRVARVVAGGRRFGFRVTVAMGNKKGKVGIGTAKGQDVTLAIEKAGRVAKKNMVSVSLLRGTIPHEVYYKFKSGKVLLKPTKAGRGIIAGGAVRAVCDLAGITHITAKMMGKSSNKINNAWATLEALKQLKTRESKSDLSPTKEKSENQKLKETRDKKQDTNNTQ